MANVGHNMSASALTVAIVSTALASALAMVPCDAWAQLSGEQAERYDDPPAPAWILEQRGLTPAQSWTRGSFVSVQVNVDSAGNNVVGDAANEPSIAVSPIDPNRIAIGWRHFDSISSNFREAGVAYSTDAGQTWAFPGVLEEGIWRSDPVLASDADGTFYYASLRDLSNDNEGNDLVVEHFQSTDGGVSWSSPIFARGGDKHWIAIDRTDGPGRGNIYQAWNFLTSPTLEDFTRSFDGGSLFETPTSLPMPKPFWLTLDVGPTGTLYAAGGLWTPGFRDPGIAVVRSQDAQDSLVTPATFSVSTAIPDSFTFRNFPQNPDGNAGNVWVATDHSGGPLHGNVYVLAAMAPVKQQPRVPSDILFARSSDGGATWSPAVRVNDDSDPDAWQWFGAMSVAPNGRIEAVWNDTREDPANMRSTVFYSYSLDGGHNWWPNRPVTPDFDSLVGFPNQNKLGDYYHMVSEDGGAALAYAATFNGEQDVYFLRIPADCNDNGIEDDCDVSCGTPAGRCDVPGCGELADANDNNIPDTCESAFVCYKTKKTKGADKLVKGIQVELDDQFNESTVYDVKKPRSLCVPASVNGAAVPDSETHLQAYQIKEASGEARHVRRSAMGMEDMLLRSAIDTKKVDRVLLAANIDPVSTPSAPVDHNLDAYACYKAKASKGQTKVPTRPSSSFADGFEDRGYDIKKLKLMCSAANKDGAGVRSAGAWLACYQIKATKGEMKHKRQQGLYSTDDVASLQQDTVKEELFCTSAIVPDLP